MDVSDTMRIMAIISFSMCNMELLYLPKGHFVNTKCVESDSTASRIGKNREELRKKQEKPQNSLTEKPNTDMIYIYPQIERRKHYVL